jgi:hypothetical protein
MTQIRTAHFNRKRFNKCQLEEWSRRVGATVLRVEYTREKARVTYKGKPRHETTE